MAVKAILNYSLSLWTYCCAFLHGQTEQEVALLKLQQSHNKVSQAYQAFLLDPFIIPNAMRPLLLTPLEHRLNQDRDCLQSFLATYDLALKEQSILKWRQAKAASMFFFPRSLPTTISVYQDIGMTSDSSVGSHESSIPILSLIRPEFSLIRP
jgi:hypothetical protein